MKGASYDAIVIGAGVIGAATAFELGKRGWKTLNVDKAHASGVGPTAASCAIVRAHYSTWDGVALAFENFHYWEDWANYLEFEDELGLARYRRSGTVLFKGADRHWEKVVAQFDAIGVPYEDWDAATLHDRIPQYSTSAFWPPSRPQDDDSWEQPSGDLDGAIYTPGSGYVSDPQLAAHNLQRAAEHMGAEFRFNERVVEILQADAAVAGVVLDGGEQIAAPVVVNVAGPWSFLVNRMAGVEETMKIKTRALRHEVHHIPAPADFDYEHMGMHTSDGDQAIYFRPEIGNHILVGSEDPECDPQVWVEDPDTFDREVSQEQWEAQVYRVARRIPDLTIPHERKGVVDLYDVSDDWIPIYDRSDLDGFYMAVGTSGNQFKNAGGVGHVMAELISACQDGHDHDIEPVHVKARYTGLELNAGFYSRNREINPVSSFSVNG
jgi:glycine/D-amino acid oxidase-like deaminating enzyme